MDTGYTYAPQFSSATSTGTFTTGTAFAVPILITQTTTTTKLNFNLVTASTASSNLYFGIYTNSTTGIDYPSTLLGAAGGVAVSASSGTPTGAKTVTISSQTLQPGIYWLAMASTNGGGTDPTITRFSQSPYVPMSTTASVQFLGNAGWSMTGSNTLQATWSSTKTLAQFGPLITIGV
jgi:hypothetical protein